MLLGDLFNPIGALVRPKTCHFVGKNGPIDNLLGARFFRILGSVSVTPGRDCVSLKGTGEEAACKR